MLGTYRVAGSMLLSRDQIQMIATGSKVEAVLNGRLCTYIAPFDLAMADSDEIAPSL